MEDVEQPQVKKKNQHLRNYLPMKKIDQIEELRKIAKLSGLKLPHQRKKEASKVSSHELYVRIIKPQF